MSDGRRSCRRGRLTVCLSAVWEEAAAVGGNKNNLNNNDFVIFLGRCHMFRVKHASALTETVLELGQAQRRWG